MKTTFAAIAGLAFVASAQVTALITPTDSAPLGCATSYSGNFGISAVKVGNVAKRQQKRADDSSSLAITLNGGILKDQQDRTGYIASNYQFQFDGPPQTGAIYTGGWSVCSNGSLALGGSALFYECLSGTFYNLYTESQGEQCSQILIQTSAKSAGGSGAVGQSSDGQATATAVATLSSAAVSQISDGQPQAAIPAAPITQISDGQVQGAPSSINNSVSYATVGAPITQISDGQVQGATSIPAAGAPITQISDGQVQGATSSIEASVSYATVGAPITQISDGQVQGATSIPAASAPTTQIIDGQVQGATSVAASATGAPISQISDGQIQGATYTASGSSAVVSQISSSPLQATYPVTLATTASSVAGAVISQISDGQIQAATVTNGTVASATATPATFTGAANNIQVGRYLAAAAVGLVAALL
ncbi:hypothetical protein SBOR_3542 [Sclerotinia borealis F-4128]|uniref:Cell wall mannoprotein PIR1-like C-terminal domain-containing protein n=1 Tax=Sclerotinia borealis (strain F-4128) TaxID=1432307 RepID=W9CNH6_SCLBF|nr:hypothetical protein SBOR_3542 [Sclerotinia borealis F-4128]